MKYFFLIINFFLFLPLCVSAQSETSSFGVKFSGFVKNDFFLDTRQVVNIREGHFLLYPMPVSEDANNEDINAEPSLNFLSIQTRLSGSITGPDAFGAKVSGVVEADFFGNENAGFVDANGFRLRHAFAKLSWQNTEILFGQYWHPFLLPGNYSEVLSFNTGVPFQPFSRNPQIRITQKAGSFSLVGAVLAQRDFTSPGGSSLLRNSIVPDMHAQIHFEDKNLSENTELYSGIGAAYKMIKPSLVSEKNNKKYITDEVVSGISATAFLKIKFPAFTYKIQGTYGENLFDALMLGGYAISKITDTTKNIVEYTTINNLAVWTEIITKIDYVELGLWAGYTENLGADENIINFSPSTIRGSDIKNVYRISPRVVFTSAKFNIGIETEYTSAAYASKDETGKLSRDLKGVITDTESVSNLRVLLTAILKF